MTDGFRIERLDAAHDRASFACESARQTDYFRTTARQHQEKRIASVFVMIDEVSGKVAGYYALSMHTIEAGTLPPETVKAVKLPKTGDLPAVLIGRLARDERYKGQRIGELIAVDAMARALRSSEQVAAVAVVADAENEAAARFWRRLNFIALPSQPLRLFLPMASVQAALA